MTRMARGPSGRLVIEIDPNLKRDLHAALAAEGITLKDWFLHHVVGYIAEHQQPSLPGITTFRPADELPSLRAAEEPAIYQSSKTRSTGQRTQ
jgi:hypothetical protein